MKNVLITGANSGIGLSISEHYLLNQPNYNIIFTTKDYDGRHTLLELHSKYPWSLSTVHFHQLNICDNSSIKALVDWLKRRNIMLNSLINNAGINDFRRDNKYTEAVMQTNYFGTVNITQSLLPLINPMGSVIFMGSKVGKLGNISSLSKKKLLNENLALDELNTIASEFISSAKQNKIRENGWKNGIFNNYSISKAFVMAYNRVIAKMHPQIVFNACCPGWCSTDMGGQQAPISPFKGALLPYKLSLQPGKSGCFYTQIGKPEMLTVR